MAQLVRAKKNRPTTIKNVTVSMLSLEFLCNLQNGVDIVLAVVVAVNDLGRPLIRKAGLPAVMVQITGDAHDGVGMVEEVQLPVSAAVPSQLQDIARQKLAVAKCPGIRPFDGKWVDVVLLV